MSHARPKILMLTTQLGYGGAETSFIRLANYLSESMEVTVALFTAGYGRSDYAGGHEALHAPVILLDAAAPAGRLRRWLGRIRRLRALKAQHDLCISFLSGPNAVNVAAGYHARSVVSLRGSRLFDPLAPRGQQLLFRRLIDPLIYRCAAGIVPVSAGLIHEIRAIAGEASAAKARVIPPFITTATLQARLQEAAPTPYNLLAGQQVIVAAGRLSPEKGVQHLITVFAHVAKAVPGSKLLLIGDGPMREALPRHCAQLGLACDVTAPETSAVLFAGYQPNVMPLLALGRVFVLPSATEGFPNAILEAMAAGTPVLAADTPWGARTIIAPEQAATPEPYPTHRPTRTPYGVLMPRIDLPEYHACWADSLCEALQKPAAPPPPFTARIMEFDVATVGNQWKQFIHDLLRQ